eukprot:TRINITY_DN18641_c0_g1_i2.p1 TRINITY_DN18641_c0_g1~~TRINITY_DN18641_c0_g1_i2.p1  ORF type:complete len:247 (+),score=42.00 TRINITY_DN18641_c0_g1_i2:71-811(+)
MARAPLCRLASLDSQHAKSSLVDNMFDRLINNMREEGDEKVQLSSRLCCVFFLCVHRRLDNATGGVGRYRKEFESLRETKLLTSLWDLIEKRLIPYTATIWYILQVMTAFLGYEMFIGDLFDSRLSDSRAATATRAIQIGSIAEKNFVLQFLKFLADNFHSRMCTWIKRNPALLGAVADAYKYNLNTLEQDLDGPEKNPIAVAQFECIMAEEPPLKIRDNFPYTIERMRESGKVSLPLCPVTPLVS